MDAPPCVVVEASESSQVSVQPPPIIQPCCSSSSFSEKKVIRLVCALESTSGDKASGADIRRRGSQTSSSPGGDVSKWVSSDGMNVPSWISRPEEVQVQKREGKLSSGGRSSKKARTDAMGSAGIDEGNDVSDKLGSLSTKGDSHGQKNNFNGKRGERRNPKASVKTKYDSFSLRSGLSGFNSPAGGGGNNLFGSFGLKTDVNDVTKLVDDISLNDLLEGTYEVPTLGKDKAKKAENVTVNILESVRKVCSILQIPRTAKPQNLLEADISSNDKPCLSSSVLGPSNEDNEDCSTTDAFSTQKDSLPRLEAPANVLEFPLEQPKDLLEKLALPPPKDLESLLIESVKLTAISKNAPDTRTSKQTTLRGSLPPFPWSHASSSNCKANSDAPKILTSKSPCQGRWARIGKTTTSHGASPKSFTDLESLKYNENLVPIHGPKIDVRENDYASSILATLQSRTAPSALVPTCELASTQSTASPSTKAQIDEHPPTVLEAAQTLCDLATYSSKLNRNGIMKWPDEPLENVTIGHKTKADDKLGESFSSSPSSMGLDHSLRSVAQMTPSKRPKLSTMVDKKDHSNHVNGVRRGPINWSTPKSSRSSPNRYATTFSVKQQAAMLPPPAKVTDKVYNGQQKVRKLMQMNWKREYDGVS